MAKSFSVTLKDDVDLNKLVEALKKGAKDEGISFKGDTKSGEASGTGVKVTYKVEEKTVTGTVSVGFPASMKYSEDEIIGKIKVWLKPYTK